MCQRPMLCVFILLVVAVGGGQGSPHLRQKLAVGGGQGSPHLRQKLAVEGDKDSPHLREKVAVEGGQGSPKLQQMVAPGDNVHFLGDISKVVQQNLDILAKMTRNLTSLMEDRRRENCSQGKTNILYVCALRNKLVWVTGQSIEQSTISASTRLV
nr:uncharacterized protein LOC123771974 [Procambarus clarkii]